MASYGCWGEEVRYVGNWTWNSTWSVWRTMSSARARMLPLHGVLWGSVQPGFRSAERVRSAAVCNGRLRFSRWRRKSEVHVGSTEFLDEGETGEGQSVEGGKDQYVRRSWGQVPWFLPQAFWEGRVNGDGWRRHMELKASWPICACLRGILSPRGPCTVLFEALFHF